jgi:hypothetical protein
MMLIVCAWLLIAGGGWLTARPDVVVRVIWKDTDIAQRLLSLTRCLGILLMVVGFVWLAITTAHPPPP